MSACPSSSCKTRKSMPASRQCVAKLWRNVCGETCLLKCMVCCCTIFQAPMRLIGLPCAFRMILSVVGCVNGRPSSIQARKFSFALLPSGTRRCLLPLPIGISHSFSRSICESLIPSASEMRSPPLYMSSIKAVSRSGFLPFAALSKTLSISSRVRY